MRLLFIGVLAMTAFAFSAQAGNSTSQSDFHVSGPHVHDNLSIYFILEQVLTQPNVRHSTYHKPDRIDTRYMGWLAVLLQEPQSTAGNVNVISWNYDLQIEHALATYSDVKKMALVHQNPRLAVYPDHRNAAKSEHKDYRPFLIHLNGLAGVLKSAPSMHDYMHDSLRQEDTRAFLNGLLEAYQRRAQGTPSLLDRTDELFTFAWEETVAAKGGMQLAQGYLSEADVLVIIGYSFPSFNRKYDRDLMHHFMLPLNRVASKRIVVQSPSMSKEDFLDIFPRIGESKIRMVTDTKQFYLPAQLL